MSEPLRFLLVEDSDDDAALILRELQKLQKSGVNCETRRVETEAAYIEQLRSFKPHLILSDYALPIFDGRAALQLARQIAPHVPFIFVSGAMGEETAVEAIKQGATDYVLKDRLASLTPTIQRALQEAAEYQRRVQAEAQLRYQASLLQNVSDAIISTDSDFKILNWNRAAEVIYGWSAQEAVGRFLLDLIPTRYPYNDMALVLQQFVKTGSWKGEVRQQNKAGEQLRILTASSLTYDDDGEITGMVLVNRDITEQKKTEEALKESQALYETIIACSPFPIISLDMNGVVLTWNEAAELLFGWTAEEIIGKLNPIVPEGKFPEFTELRNRIRNGEILSNIEIKRHNRRGDSLDLRLSAAPIRDAQGKTVAISAAFEDVTERNRAARQIEQERAAQTRRLQQILDAVPDGVVLLNAAGRAILANLAGQTLLQRLTDVNPDEPITTLGGQPLNKLLRLSGNLAHSWRCNAEYYELLSRPIQLANEQNGWVLLLRDVTIEHEREQYTQVQERLATVGQLAAGIAHDFNNVMAIIILYAQLLQQMNRNLPQKSAKHLQTIEQQAHHAANMIGQILDFSRRSIMERAPFNFLSLLKELINLLRATVSESIEISLKSASADYLIHADPTRIQQALMNIALNARDAMPEGGQLQFDLSALTTAPEQAPPLLDMPPGRWLRLAIHDNGKGIAPEHLPRIFDPFFTTKGPGKGTGLGLAQVYGIIKQHDGYIAVESRVGGGSAFILYLPLLSAEAATAETTLSDREQDFAGMGAILLVEDNEIMRVSVAETLAQLGYRVLEAENGMTALTLLENADETIDLIISDVVMPKMGGTDLLNAVKQRYPEVPVLLMTGYPLGETEPGLEGAAWISKPFTMRALGAKIQELLEKGA